MDKPRETRASKAKAIQLMKIKKRTESIDSSPTATLTPTTVPPPIKKLKSDLIKVEKIDQTFKFVGGHVSIAGGISKSVDRAVKIGAKSFALFLKSNHQWLAKPISVREAKEFKRKCAAHNFPPQLIVPHGSYLLNCGSPDKETLAKSRAALVEELTRCEELGLTLFNFHPGSSCGQISQLSCIKRIVTSINMALKKTEKVVVLIENMCGQGNTIGGDFNEIKKIIDGVRDKSRVGVCLDTCHAFAYGYDLACEEGFQKMMTDLEDIVGLKYLKAVHLNDSVGACASHLDRHANIGHGLIGVEGFRRIMNDCRFNGIPMILETPPEVLGYEEEIKILNSLQKS